MGQLIRATVTRRLAGAWLLALVGMGLAAPYLPLPFSPVVPDLLCISVSPGQGAAAGHWLGTDPLGRDVLANLLFGARTVLLLTVPAALLTAVLGAVLGSMMGYGERAGRVPAPVWLLGAGLAWWGLALPRPGLGLAGCAVAGAWALGLQLMRRAFPRWSLPLDALLLGAGALLGTVPRLLLAAAVAARGPLSLGNLLALLVLTSWPGPARLVRAETLRARALPFVEAARAMGLPTCRIWLRYVLPQALRPLRTDLPLSLATLLGLESTLSFLGLGFPPEVASWGHLLAAARLDTGAWWVVVFPVAALLLTTAALHTLARQQSRAL